MNVSQFKEKFINEDETVRNNFRICLHQYYGYVKKCDRYAEHIADGECVDNERVSESIENMISSFKCCQEYKSKLGERTPLIEVHSSFSTLDNAIKVINGEIKATSDTINLANKLYGKEDTSIHDLEVATYCLSILLN